MIFRDSTAPFSNDVKKLRKLNAAGEVEISLSTCPLTPSNLTPRCDTRESLFLHPTVPASSDQGRDVNAACEMVFGESQDGVRPRVNDRRVACRSDDPGVAY